MYTLTYSSEVYINYINYKYTVLHSFFLWHWIVFWIYNISTNRCFVYHLSKLLRVHPLSWWNLATVVPRCSWSRKDPPSNYLPKKWRDLGLMMFWILDPMFPGCWFFRFHVKFFGGKFVKVYQLGWMSVWLSNFALVFPYRPAGGRRSYWGGVSHIIRHDWWRDWVCGEHHPCTTGGKEWRFVESN